jgi:anti-sigma-K factor RskA
VEEAKAYIETGILELYVLGQLDVSEQKEVEDMAARYPGIKDEINAIEIAMEKYAVFHAIKPTSGLEKKIFEKIAPSASDKPTTSNPKILPLNADHSASEIRSLRFALVACVGLLVLSFVALYAMNNKLGKANEQIASLNGEKEKFASTVSYMKGANKDLLEIAAITDDPSWTVVKLGGTNIAPQAKMRIFWHKGGQHVMLDNTRMSLPENDSKHQYQLWAIVKGKPVDLGVFDAESQPAKLLLTMKEIGNAQAFAVTLEKRGGCSTPTMEKMIVQGAVSI